MTNIESVLNQARKLIGVKQYSPEHEQLVKDYNSVHPLPVGYVVSTTDDWCDIFITTIFIRENASNLIGRECGVERHINIFKGLGIWIEDGTIIPQKGDIITFYWGQTVQPNDGFASHIGIVENVEGNTITTIEGNSNGMVSRRYYNIGEGTIRGYARPKYLDQSSKQGTWNKDLVYGGHRLTSNYINALIKIGKKYNVLPSFMITQLYLESNWGASAVAKTDNNLAGMTWTGDPNRPSGVVVERGSARPANEGGYYMRYRSVEDFFTDWSYLYRLGGNYNVSGKNFEEAIKGLFTIGGAKANYAEIGYYEYANVMRSVKSGIERENGQGILEQIDNHLYTGDTYTPPVTPDDKETLYYTVQAGDSLWGISQKYNISLDELCMLNNISVNTVIHPGDRLIVKRGTIVDTVPEITEKLIQSYPESGKFTANTAIYIRNSYSTAAPIANTLYSGESVYYDSVYITTTHLWLSYVSFSGVRRYIAVRTYNNGTYGPLWGTII